MAARKKTTRKTPAPPSATAEGRFSILMEHMAEQNRATIEAVQSLEQKMDRRFEEAERKNEIRFSSLETAVRMNSQEIRKNSEEIRKNSEDIQALSTQVQALTSEVRSLVRRVERIEEMLSLKAEGPQVADLEARIRRIEERLGIVAT